MEEGFLRAKILFFGGEGSYDFQENERGISRCFQSIQGEQ